MVLFFEQFPEYKSILKVKRLSYVGDKTYVRWTDKNNIIPYSEIYIESHDALKKVLLPKLQELKGKHEENIASANDIYLAFQNHNNQNAPEEHIDSDDLTIPSTKDLEFFF